MAKNNNRHIKVYRERWNLGEQDFHMCEINGCNRACADVHHIRPRSAFGKRGVKQQDDFENLIGLCRLCHNKAHSSEYSEEWLNKQKKTPFTMG